MRLKIAKRPSQTRKSLPKLIKSESFQQLPMVVDEKERVLAELKRVCKLSLSVGQSIGHSIPPSGRLYVAILSLCSVHWSLLFFVLDAATFKLFSRLSEVIDLDYDKSIATIVFLFHHPLFLTSLS